MERTNGVNKWAIPILILLCLWLGFDKYQNHIEAELQDARIDSLDTQIGISIVKFNFAQKRIDHWKGVADSQKTLRIKEERITNRIKTNSYEIRNNINALDSTSTFGGLSIWLNRRTSERNTNSNSTE